MATTYTLVPIPLWYFADNTGKPLGGGYMATWRSVDKITPKAIFADPAGNFPWINPVFFNANGEAPGMFFWADDEPYFVQVFDAQNNLIFTVDGYGPGIAGGGGGGTITTSNSFLENYITNNIFYRNTIGSTPTVVTNGTVIAPSNHEGFAFPDIQYVRLNGTGSTDLISFPTTMGDFSAGSNPLVGDVTPETYVDWSCTVSGNELTKAIQFPVDLHIKNLESQTMTAIIWAKGILNASISVSFAQNTGTGAITSGTILTPTGINQSVLANTWNVYIGTFVVPTTSGLTLGSGGDDASYLQVLLPTSSVAELYFTKPKLYIGTIANVFPELPSYDYVDRIISLPRTGDTRLTFSNVTPGGFVPMNDGTIGNSSSNATTFANQSSWQLFNLLWNNVSNLYCPIFTSSGAVTTRGSNASADFGANKQLALPKALGRVFAGANPGSIGLTKFFTASNVAGDLAINIDDSTPFYTGNPVTFTNVGGSLPTGLVVNTTYYLVIDTTNPTVVFFATSSANAVSATLIAFTNAGSGTNSFTTTVSASSLGEFVGENLHALLVSEMAEHNHTPQGGGLFSTINGINPVNTAGVLAGQGEIETTSIVGGSTGHNNLQPTTYGNVYIKL